MRFDVCARSYDSHAGPQRAFAARVAQFIGRPSGVDVLELGAGTGALTAHLCAGPGLRVRATDLSPAMVRIGREKVPSAEWFELDAFGGRVPSAELQVSSGLLQWARDPLPVLRGWRAALKPGGRMVHAFACDPCLREWRELVPETPLQWRDQAGWLAVFEQAGLEVIRQQLWVEPVLFDSALELLRAWHESGVTSAPRIGAGRLREALRRYDRLHAHPDGVVATWAWLAVEARG